jgi:alpha-tubulin suppressor-like RCC1 family protein
MRVVLVAASIIAAAGCSTRPLDLPEAETLPDLAIPPDMTLAPVDLAAPPRDLSLPAGPDLAAPLDMSPAHVATQVSAGYAFTCAVFAGAAKCWGANAFGQLGDGTNADSALPVGVVGLSTGVIAVAAGAEHACAVTSVGGISCWGANLHGQLGDGTTHDSNIPVSVVGLSGIIAASSGGSFSCALGGNGPRVRCWGADSVGQLGDGATTDSSTPVAVAGLDGDIAAIASGLEHSCAIGTGGVTRCWGYNDDGQLGNGSISDSHVPVAIAGFSASLLGLGGDKSCAVSRAGGAFCWGGNQLGQLGNGTYDNSTAPAAVSGASAGIAGIFGGLNHACAFNRSGRIACWGYNNKGQLGDGVTYSGARPVDVFGLTSGVMSGGAGWEHTCAVMASGGIKCWGSNDRGELGNGTTSDSLVPVDVVGL